MSPLPIERWRGRHGRSFLLALGILIGCSASKPDTSPGSASVNGSVSGVTLRVASQYAIPSFVGCSTPGGDGGFETCVGAVAIAIDSRADDTCTTLESANHANEDVGFANSALLSILIGPYGDVTKGAYPIAGGAGQAGVDAEMLRYDGSCNVDIDETATTGSVTIVEIDKAHVTGTYALTFGTSGSLSGSFDVSYCDLSLDVALPSGSMVCR